MGTKKVIDADQLDAAMTATADAIREKTSGTDPIPWNADTGFAEAVAGITGGGAAVPVPMKDVNFYDYDGTRLYSYTVAEAAALTELPPPPTQPGLICQGWNWTLDGIKAMGRAVDVGAMYITDDGKTRIYITLQEGRTSPVFGCSVTGTVTVDWGDETEPEVLSGNANLMWTYPHNYAAPGDYVITLTVDGTMTTYASPSTNNYSGLLRHSSETDARNRVYQNSIKRVEIGENVAIGAFAFRGCGRLEKVTIPKGVANATNGMFYDCYSLSCVVIPDTATMTGLSVFYACDSLHTISLPPTIERMGNKVFESHTTLERIVLPDGLDEIKTNMFNGCYSLASIVIPQSITYIAPTSFAGCSGVKFYDFSRLTAIPPLGDVNSFEGIPDDCEIRVPAALADEWKAATNWATYADYIVGV